ncbi:helix-turn-helix domain-containing protein [Corynebacterium phoceense]
MPNSNLSNFVAAEIRAEMGRQELTPHELAEKTGISDNTIRRTIRGKRDFTFSELLSIGEALGVEIAELITRGSRVRDEAA